MKKNDTGLLEDPNQQQETPDQEGVLLNKIAVDTTKVRRILEGMQQASINTFNLNKSLVRTLQKNSDNSLKVLESIAKNTKIKINDTPQAFKQNTWHGNRKNFTASNNAGRSSTNKKPRSTTKKTPVTAKKIKSTQTTEAVISGKSLDKINQSIKKLDLNQAKASIQQARTLTNQSKQTEKSKVKSTIPSDWKQDANGRYRDKTGKYVSEKELKKHGLSNKEQTEDLAKERRLLDALDGIQTNMPQVENLDPIIQASKELSSTVGFIGNLGKGLMKGLTFARGIFAGKKTDDTPQDKEQRGFFNFSRKKEKDENKFRKKALDYLKTLSEKGENKDKGLFSTLINTLGVGKLFTKGGIASILGGALGLKALKNKVKTPTTKGKLGGLFEKVKMPKGLATFAKATAKRTPLLGSLLAFADGGIGGGIGALAGGAIGSILGPIGTVVGGIIGEKVGKWLATFNWQSVGDSVTKSWNETLTNITSFFELIPQSWNDLTKFITDIFTNAPVSQKIEKTYTTAKEWVTSFFTNKDEQTEKTAQPKATKVQNSKIFSIIGAEAFSHQGSKNIQTLNRQETGSYLNTLAKRESGGNHKAVNSYGYLGAYQMGVAALVESGMIKRENYQKAIKQHKGIATGANAKAHNDFLNDPNNWTIQGGKEAFLNNRALQDNAIIQFTNKNYQSLAQKGVIKDGMDNGDTMGYLMAAHLKGVGGAVKLSQGVASKDGYGTSTNEYFNLGTKAYALTRTNNSHQNVNIEILKSTNIAQQSFNKTQAESYINEQIRKSQLPPQQERTKSQDKPQSFNLQTLLTQDVSDRNIAHIVTGGLTPMKTR